MKDNSIIGINPYDFILEHIKSDPTLHKILDGGCGNGTLLKQLEAHNYSAVGIENEETLVTQLTNQKLNVVQGSLTDLSMFQDNCFDCVVLSLVLHHISQPRQAIKEAFRVTRKKLIIVEGYAEPTITFCQNSAELSAMICESDTKHNHYHQPFLNLGSILGYCEEIMFEIQSFNNISKFSLEEITEEDLLQWIERVRERDLNQYNQLRRFILSKSGFAKFGLNLNTITKAGI